MDSEDILISAIQNQQMVEIQFRKETGQGEWVVREVAPYDVYDKTDKRGHIRRIMLGYCWEHKDYKAAPIYVYLDTINRIELLNGKFDGLEIEKLINPKQSPNISRTW